MRGAIPPFPQYIHMEWCSVKKKAQGLLYFYKSNCRTVNTGTFPILGHITK